MMMKEVVKQIPGTLPLWRYLQKFRSAIRFQGSAEYWQRRYCEGGNSGAGSFGELALFKAETINSLLREHGLHSAIELGCGDGNQLSLIHYPRYLGVDVSTEALALCRTRYAADRTKRFTELKHLAGETAEVSLSLDVIYHLVEDHVFDAHMCAVFDAATRFVVIYSSNTDGDLGNAFAHVRHRKFTDWVDRHRQEWKLVSKIVNPHPFKVGGERGSFADFYVYTKEALRHE